MGYPRSYSFEVICSFERGSLRISLILQRVEVHLWTHSLPWRDLPDLCIYRYSVGHRVWGRQAEVVLICLRLAMSQTSTGENNHKQPLNLHINSVSIHLMCHTISSQTWSCDLQGFQSPSSSATSVSLSEVDWCCTHKSSTFRIVKGLFVITRHVKILVWTCGSALITGGNRNPLVVGTFWHRLWSCSFHPRSESLERPRSSTSVSGLLWRGLIQSRSASSTPKNRVALDGSGRLCFWCLSRYGWWTFVADHLFKSIVGVWPHCYCCPGVYRMHAHLPLLQGFYLQGGNLWVKSRFCEVMNLWAKGCSHF